MPVRQRTWRVVLAPVLACTIAAVACSGGDGEPEPTGCKAPACPVDTSGVDLTTPAVSFELDVLPVFRRSCGLSSACHGSQGSSAAKLYLGPKKSDTTTVIDAAFRQKLIDGLADVPSLTAPAVALVEPGDPAQSFLMLKVDGCHDSAGLACKPQPKSKSGAQCGDRMPQGSTPACPEDRDVIRRWIAQGAKND
jgi:hypothetical protein